MKIKLNQKTIDRELLCPAGKKQIEFCDSELPGLYVLVSSVSPGIGTYYLRYKNDSGKTCHKKIARTTDISLKDARDSAKRLKLEINQGKDPQAETKQKRNEMTYAEFMEEHYFPYVTPRLRNAGGYRQQYDKYLKDAFGKFRVREITKTMIRNFHEDLHIGKSLSQATANRYLQLIKASINFGINMEVLDLQRNPAVGIKLFEETPNDRHLSSEELPRLMPILIKEDSQPARIIRFLLLTGLRLSECLLCEWKHIDIENKVMVIPSYRSKNKRTDSIPLSNSAVALLQECDKSTRWPFVNMRSGRYYTTIDKSFKRLINKANITDKISLHGLRHTFASQLLSANRSIYEIKTLLRHRQVSTTERYSHLSRKSALASVDAVSEQLQRAAAGNQ